VSLATAVTSKTVQGGPGAAALDELDGVAGRAQSVGAVDDRLGLAGAELVLTRPWEVPSRKT
jgi:hypothetical protein